MGMQVDAMTGGCQHTACIAGNDHDVAGKLLHSGAKRCAVFESAPKERVRSCGDVLVEEKVSEGAGERDGQRNVVERGEIDGSRAEHGRDDHVGPLIRDGILEGLDSGLVGRRQDGSQLAELVQILPLVLGKYHFGQLDMSMHRRGELESCCKL